jgi:NADH-quinone oxidoreductase subunit N
MTALPTPDSFAARLQEVLPPLQFYLHASPIFILMAASFSVLLLGVFRSNPARPSFPAVGITVMACAAALLPPLVRPVVSPASYLANGFLADSLTQYGFIAIALGTLVTALLASCTNTGRNLMRPELAALLLLSSSGLMVMISAGEFLSFFIGLELTSIPLYVLVGFQRDNTTALEASIKYFLLGAVASGLILIGMAFLYLHTGSTGWSSFSRLFLNGSHPFATLGMLLFVTGLAFKLSLAPFHSWAPDVYQGANSLLTGYMSGLVKLGVVLVFLRILTSGIHDDGGALVFVFWILGALSIVLGSLFGLVQKSIKRILAYSSIANAGYFVLAFAALAKSPHDATAIQALVAYSGIYLILTLGSFGILAWLEEGENEDIERDAIRGLGYRNPFAAVAFTIFLLGLAGIPPLAGFFGKLWLVMAAVKLNLVGLAIVMVIFSGVSLFYYLSLIANMWFHARDQGSITGSLVPNVQTLMKATIGALLVASLFVGLLGPRWALTHPLYFATGHRAAALPPTP